MIHHTRKGQTSSGEAIGILLLDTSVPFIPGDVANATTYSFPVRYGRVPGYSVARALDRDPSVYAALLAAARELVDQGVRAVTGDCGFMLLHQRQLAAELDVPVFLSSLLQIPFVSMTLGPKAKVGVITADSRSLTSELLRSAGVEPLQQVVIEGLEGRNHFYDFAINETGYLDEEAVEAEVVAAAENLLQREPSVRALLLECSLLPPYAAAVQQAVRLPVFDYITMIEYVFSAVVRRRYSGFI